MKKYQIFKNEKYNDNIPTNYSIVMTYYKRYNQLSETLKSFNQYIDKNIEVIIVNDGPDENLIDLIKEFHYPILLIQVDINLKNYCNSCIPFNLGFKYIKSPITIIQNAECLHHNNLIEISKIFNLENTYQVFSCYSLSKEDTVLYCNDKFLKFNNSGAMSDGESAWYNHSIFRPSGYHFCSMISTNNLNKLGGFDERYRFGIGFDDDEFLYRVKNSNFLNLKFNDLGIVLHQWHYTSGTNKNLSLVNRNRFLFAFITKRNFSYKFFEFCNNIKLFNKSIIDYTFLIKDNFK